MNVILSIKPEHIMNIRKNIKKYEYRSRIFKEEVSKIYIYETKPTMKIVGFVNYKGFLHGPPEYVWELTKQYSGVSEKFYNSYFENKEVAYAIDFSEVIFFDEKVNPQDIDPNFYPPQSYRYIRS